MERLLITNCRLFDAPSGEQATSILIEDGVITRVGAADPCENTLDAEGRIIAPGFIDIHIQGAGDADVLDGTVEALSAISQTSARFGVTGFLATTVFKPEGGNEHLAVAADCVGRDLGGASLLGIHLIPINDRRVLEGLQDCAFRDFVEEDAVDLAVLFAV